MGAPNFDAPPAPQQPEFTLFGQTWCLIPLEDAIPAIDRVSRAGLLPKWQYGYELLICVRDCVEDATAFDAAVETLGLPPDLIERLIDATGWIIDTYREQMPATDDLHARIEAELGPQRRASEVRDPTAVTAVLAAGGELG